jgi:hypothetical protein
MGAKFGYLSLIWSHTCCKVRPNNSIPEVKPVMEPRDRDFARLADWVEGRLSDEEARSVEEQVAADSTMQADVAWLRAFNLASEHTVLASLPPEVRGALVKRFQEYAERKRRSGSLKRYFAELSFDSARQLALGLRANSTPESQREFVYSSEVADIAISVRLRAHDRLWDCDGQVFPLDGTDPGAFGARLLDGSSEVATTTTNDLGEFSFGAVSPGTYDVFASSDHMEIRLAGVEVRQRR